MAEPPAKRARRTDSSTMWDINQKPPRSSDLDPDHDRHSRQNSTKPDGYRKGGRDDHRFRSRSRDRNDRRRDRTRSRDRYDRDRDRDSGKRDRERDGRGVKERDRSTSIDRYQNRRGYTSKSDRYERSRSPTRNGNRIRSRTPPRGYKPNLRDDRRNTRPRDDGRHTNGTAGLKESSRARVEGEKDVDMQDPDEDPDDIDAQIRKMVGFTRFRSTKNTKVPGNDIYGVRKEKKTEYRQYMNRTGGFNRPLSPTR